LNNALVFALVLKLQNKSGPLETGGEHCYCEVQNSKDWLIMKWF